MQLPSQIKRRSWTRHSSHWIKTGKHIFFRDKIHGFLSFPAELPFKKSQKSLQNTSSHGYGHFRAAACCQSRSTLADSRPRAPARTAEGRWALKSWREYRHLPRRRYPESIAFCWVKILKLVNRKPPRFPVSKRALSENGDSKTKIINCYCHFWLCLKLLHLPPGWENDDQATNPLLGPSGLPGCRGRDSICSINPEKSHEKWSRNGRKIVFRPSAAPCR